ncbi:HEAT repeat domain-containing protein [Mesorhizobium argentiipisi]|uniref:HEAT repeat domain-containing protein n=1 Tax=Mesorhizobium argentiipisi TaxID=3015175 RepID=A0ABU8KHY5_9HYPH
MNQPPVAAQEQIIPDIVRQHVEQAAFLWAQRDLLAAQEPPDEKVIADIDRRLEANLDGVRVAGSAVWPFVIAAYNDFPEKGELFLYGWTAIEQTDGQRILEAVEEGRTRDDDAHGLVGALAWHDAKAIRPLVRNWIASEDEFKRYLAVAACLEHGVDPKDLLVRLVRDPDMRVRATSLRLAGTAKRGDLVREIATALESQHEAVRLSGALALNELGHAALAKPELHKQVLANGPDALIALRAIVKIGPDKDVRTWMGGLLKSPDTAPLAVRGAGMLGDRTILNWLIRQMRDPTLAVAAGGALLELFPEARNADLFTLDPADIGQAFEDHFGDFSPNLPVADKVAAWGRAAALLG